MTPRPLRRHTVAAAALGAALLASACSPEGSQNDEADSEGSQNEQAEQNPIPQPEYDSDDSVRLPIGLVSPPGHNEIAPLGEDGRISEVQGQEAFGQSGPSPHQTEIARTDAFGCGDTISVIQTVPMVTDDPGHAALDYLLSLESTTHGDPAFGNPMAVSEDLTVESVELDGDQVTVMLEGEPAARDSCETWRVAKQIETTARMATGADAVEIQLEDTTLAEYWGFGDDSPLQITEIQRD